MTAFESGAISAIGNSLGAGDLNSVTALRTRYESGYEGQTVPYALADLLLASVRAGQNCRGDSRAVEDALEYSRDQIERALLAIRLWRNAV